MVERIEAGIWRHVKGHNYLVLGLADDSNNVEPRPEPQVVYVSLDTEGRVGRPLHTRSISEFLERFTLVAGAQATVPLGPEGERT